MDDTSQPRPLNRIAFSPPEVARVLGVGEATVYRLLRAGSLPRRKIGRRTLVAAEDLRRLLDAAGARR
jgi:excisionase family DNA binding protein